MVQGSGLGLVCGDLALRASGLESSVEGLRF